MGLIHPVCQIFCVRRERTPTRGVCVEARKVEARHVRGIPRRFRCLAPRALCRRNDKACPVGLTTVQRHETDGPISVVRFFATFAFRLCAARPTPCPLVCPLTSPIMSARLAIAGTLCRAPLSPAFG